MSLKLRKPTLGYIVFQATRHARLLLWTAGFFVFGLLFYSCGERSADTVWSENPGYGGALAAFRAAGLAIEGIAVDEEGMAPAAQDWRARRPRLIYATPSHQYPVGTVLSLARRLALIDGARRAGALIIEDDYDSEFRHDGPPLAAMQGLAPDAPVLYCGTFSKTMFPGLRIGYLVVPPSLAPQLALLRAQSAAAGRVAVRLAGKPPNTVWPAFGSASPKNRISNVSGPAR